jgi:hypothetical protein
MKIPPNTPRLFLILVFVFAVAACGIIQESSPPEPTSTPFPTAPPLTPSPTWTESPTLRPSSTPLPTFTIAPSLTPIPTNTPTPGIEGLGETTGVFRDDFSDPLSGWPVGDTGDYSFGYSGGGYLITNNIPNAEVCASRTRGHTDFVIEAVARKISGPNDAYFGVTCRKTGNNYYTLGITGNGDYVIYQTTAGLRERLIQGPSSAIKKGDATNELVASCIGDVLTLEVNGVQVVSIVHEGPKIGSFVGLVVGTMNTPGVEVLFDNFNSHPPP